MVGFYDGAEIIQVRGVDERASRFGTNQTITSHL